MTFFTTTLKQAALTIGMIFFSMALYPQSYQARVNKVLEKYAADYPDLFIAKGPTEIIVNDTSFPVAGSVSNGSMVVAITWKGQRRPGQNQAYVFLQYDTTVISGVSFSSKLYGDIAAALGLTGLQRTKRKVSGKVFPNPSGGKCTLLVSGENRPYTARVFNAEGRCVFRQKGTAPEGKIHLSLHGLPAGSYVITVLTSREKYVYRELLK